MIAAAPRAGGARVDVERLCMEYTTSTGWVRALDDVTLSVEAGTSLAVVGPSGCGKSTLLGIIGGLELPTTGEVRVGDRVVTALRDADRAALRRRDLGFVFQADNLQPFLTVHENIGMQAVMAGIPDEPAHRQALLAALGVDSLGHRFPDQLSGGQRLRVAVARALVHSPSLILADEPTGSLDSANSDKVVELLLQLQKDAGATLVVVTHDRSVAEQMDAVVEMTGGRVTGMTGVRS